MQKITLSKIEHKGESRIRVDFPYAAATIQAIKQIEGRLWSQSKKCWHVPYANTTFRALQESFDIELIQNDFLPIKTSSSSEENKTQSNKQSPSTIRQKELPDNSPKEKSSQSKKVPITGQKEGRAINRFTGNTILLEQLNEQWIKAFVPFDKKGWINIIKDIPGRSWQPEHACWILPNVQESFKQLWKLIGKQYIRLTFSIQPNIPKEFIVPKKANKKSPKFQLNEVQKNAITVFEEKLLLENKAWRTRKTYKGLFIHFIAYFPATKPSSISKKQIEKYIIYKKQDNVSDSQLNQIINCLNCFFIRILQQDDKVVKLERPKKKRKLPNIYSLEEIEILIKTIDNLKHKCMIILVYSGGLRKSEVLNLRVDDLNFHRKALFIKNSKGGKDRYTFFSDIARKYLAEYLKQYQPRYYLFEGQTGGRYSETSLQTIFEKARKKAKLGRTVTLHGLRHSFATHLAEKGVVMPAIKDLLGHGSIKTTEIYLHLSNKYRNELKSPLDDLDL